MSNLEIKQLEVSLFQIDFFADSLKHKRMNEVSKQLPFSYSKFRTEFEELFIKYANTYLPSGIKKHRDDAEKFVEYVKSFKTEYYFFRILLNYEITNLKMYDKKILF